MTNVRETVRDAFEAVKGTVQHTAKSVKETVAAAKQVDVEGIIDRHPWLFIGGFMTLGYVAYRVLEHAGTSAKAPGAAPCPKNGSPHDNGPHDNGPHDNGRHDSGRHEPEPASQEPTPSPPTPAAENWAELMTELKALAIGVPLSVRGTSWPPPAPKPSGARWWRS